MNGAVNGGDSPVNFRWNERRHGVRTVGGELQTDATFDHDIIERMEADIYDTVFVPAITEARAQGKSYESIRDIIRRGWKSARTAAR